MYEKTEAGTNDSPAVERKKQNQLNENVRRMERLNALIVRINAIRIAESLLYVFLRLHPLATATLSRLISRQELELSIALASVACLESSLTA